MGNNVRVRFAPSPTGALHIGGVRTALYNYLFAKQQGGKFLLRIEDTDQTRYTEGAEDYILEALKWCGMTPDEGVGAGGEYGPYRQSERKPMYKDYALKLIEAGHAYYAFDTSEDLEKMREDLKKQGNPAPQYNAITRQYMKNSTSLPTDEVERRLAANEPYVVRLKVPRSEEVKINDVVRGWVTFQSKQLDDKVLLKTDGMPTYHLANVVDDYLMKITHVIRGEEWLPSTPTHVLLYKYFGWEEQMPTFAHLPLILKPNGKGKLSKRDGDKLGMPVFPIDWVGATAEDSFKGFREMGFFPGAVINFLSLLGWSPEGDQELLTKEDLIQAFDLNRINKSGARFDYDKAKWFNQQYIKSTDDTELAAMIEPLFAAAGYDTSKYDFSVVARLLKERVVFMTDFVEQGYYLFEELKSYDEKTIRKKWKPENRAKFEILSADLAGLGSFTAEEIEKAVKAFMEANSLGFGQVLPILRVGLTGTMQGPPIFEMMELMGQEFVKERMGVVFDTFDAQHAAK